MKNRNGIGDASIASTVIRASVVLAFVAITSVYSFAAAIGLPAGDISAWCYYEDYSGGSSEAAAILRTNPDFSLKLDGVAVDLGLRLTTVLGHSADYAKRELYGEPRLDLREAFITLTPLDGLVAKAGVFPYLSPGLLAFAGSAGGFELDYSLKSGAILYGNWLKLAEGALTDDSGTASDDKDAIDIGARLSVGKGMLLHPAVMALIALRPDSFVFLPQCEFDWSLLAGKMPIDIVAAGAFAAGRAALTPTDKNSAKADVACYALKLTGKAAITKDIAAGTFFAMTSPPDTASAKVKSWGAVAPAMRLDETEYVLKGRYDDFWCPDFGTVYADAIAASGILSFGANARYAKGPYAAEAILAMHLESGGSNKAYGFEANLLGSYALSKNADLRAEASLFAPGSYFSSSDAMPALALGIVVHK
jgi:hypothetical protein